MRFDGPCDLQIIQNVLILGIVGQVPDGDLDLIIAILGL